MQKLRDMIFSNPWTSLIFVLSVGALAVYGKVLSVPQIINFVLTAVLGVTAADGGKGVEK